MRRAQEIRLAARLVTGCLAAEPAAAVCDVTSRGHAVAHLKIVIGGAQQGQRSARSLFAADDIAAAAATAAAAAAAAAAAVSY